MFSLAFVRRSILAAVLLLALCLSDAAPLSVVHATSSPCEDVIDSPPVEGGGPLVAGDITNAQTSSPISGVTVALFRCSAQTGVYVTAVTTNSGGYYAFTSLAGGYYYYVEAILVGPLGGMQPASGTANPSAVIAVGPGDSAVDLSFQ
jgi:hypothetical protein